MSDLFDVSHRLALVTGSTRGLGRSLAAGLARAGARIIVHGRSAEAAARTAAEIAEESGTPAASVAFDVTDAAAVETGVAAMIDEHGVPDILVNNAGVQRRAPIQEFSVSDWDDIMAANLNGVFYVSRFVAPAMIERGSGKIVNIASVQSSLARQTIAPYSASKGGVAQLTKGMAADLARHGIQVNALSPGYFATEMNRDLVDDPAFSGWLTQRTPAQRWGDFAELDGALRFLASDASSFVSGQNIFVDGGMTAVV
ncbi:SDR family oxidoreductase [Microbacterium xanthum]|uniref:SDR family oxidoreductase n=1 Tax=Microbacterium xanthum TaxID=3079794 RepID=UPI002AD35A82|nr:MULTISPECIES: SDR family oxidoreductase [unclassified Microbacterium]MDZ8172046.1 SDR family oxidoreductase [Microbacterium sp. KSW-48]MDZ8202247.1 SDR family oxidoreductase [Microbacterium sp. SSW1-59]